MKNRKFLERLGLIKAKDSSLDYYFLGMRYLGEGNWKEAVESFKKINFDDDNFNCNYKTFAKNVISADQGDAEAQYYLGFCNENGKCVEKDLERAIQWYEKSAKQSFAEAMYRLGVIFFSNYYNHYDEVVYEVNKKKNRCRFYYCKGKEIDVEGNRKKAFILFEKAAKLGHVEAQYRVGMCYAEGKVVKEDWGKALKCFRKIEDKIDMLNIHKDRKIFVENVILAEKGYSEAQCFLGECYAKGKGIEKDLRKSFKWYEKAAKQGSIEARYQVGMCYIEGKGVKENWGKAIESFTFIHDKLDDLKVNAERKAFVKCAVFSEKGSANYQYLLGNCYARGKGIKIDWKKAIKWITKSAEQNYPQAQWFIGLCYKQGKGVKMNWEKSFECFENAAEQGLAQAQYELGMCYKRGDGIDVNSSLAKKWLGKAADQGYEKAAIELNSLKPTYSGGCCASPDYDFNINP